MLTPARPMLCKKGRIGNEKCPKCKREGTHVYIGSTSLCRGGAQVAIDYCPKCHTHFVRDTGEVFSGH